MTQCQHGYVFGLNDCPHCELEDVKCERDEARAVAQEMLDEWVFDAHEDATNEGYRGYLKRFGWLKERR